MPSVVFSVLLVAEIAAFLMVRRMIRSSNPKRHNRVYHALSLVAFLVIWAITLKFIVFPPVRDLPTTGRYQIASSDYWVDEAEADPYLDNDQPRELQVRKWYPVDAQEDHPVIVASHGSCGTIDNNVSLYRELASHGYTVLAVCHPGQAAYITYEDGRAAGPSAIFLKQMTTVQPQTDPEQAYRIFSEWMGIRIADLNAVMDAYEADMGETTFISLGHSLGGAAAYAMARVRNDVVGCIALESPCMYDIKGVENEAFIFDDSDYDVPLLNIYSDSSYPHLREWGQYGNNVMFLDRGKPAYTSIHYEGVGHMGLCDLSIVSPLLSAALSGGFQEVDAYTQLERMNADCIGWLNEVVSDGMAR